MRLGGKTMKKILFATSEAVPFIKTGGLADVAGSLPKYFNKDEYDVRVMLPKYACMKDVFKDQLVYNTHYYMDFNSQKKYVGILEMEYEGIKFCKSIFDLSKSTLSQSASKDDI